MRRVIWCVFSGMAVLLFLYTRSGTSWFLICCAAVLPCGALILAAAGRNRISAELKLPAELRKKSSVHVIVSVRNESAVPIARTELLLSVKNAFTGREEKIRLECPVRPHGCSNITVDFSSDCCGLIDFACREIRIFDFLGLYGFVKKVDLRERRMIQPETFTTKIALTGGEMPGEGSDIFSNYYKGSEMISEPLQIREYAEGDSLKHIHWKLTGRLGRYMVIDPALEMNHALLLIWAGESIPEGATPRVPDTLAEAFFSVCISLVEEGIPFCAAWKRTENENIAVQDISSVDDVVDIMADILRGGAKQGGSYLPVWEKANRNFPLTVYFSYRKIRELSASGKGRVAGFICIEDEENADPDAEGCRFFSPDNYQNVLQSIQI